ncbi:hypothetical protein CW662_07450 [Macrococcoides caseolyticum]|uniref:hypothetical protein n=1 Tax=Staphylococcaceae TaxID=90964 RepID=UPI000C340BA9|nr:hypothetical protein [Macrococcus caseolyticus]PKE69696.1 hypothetical protein CW662_07450 [Macrococcus caseolyticus]
MRKNDYIYSFSVGDYILREVWEYMEDEDVTLDKALNALNLDYIDAFLEPEERKEFMALQNEDESF